MIIQLTLDQARSLLAGDPAEIESLRKALAFADVLPWPEPPRLSIYRDGQLVVEYYEDGLCARIEAAIEAAVRVQVYKETVIEWP